jgi:hypothetical protein
MKKTLLLFITLLTISASFVSGQNKQAGIRGGYRSGIFYQINTNAGNAGIGYNALLSFNNAGLQLTGLKIIYAARLEEFSPDLYLAWGYGAHAGFGTFYKDTYDIDNYVYHRRVFSPMIGVDGWGAIEYRFNEIPMNISLNVKPFLELTFPAIRFMPVDFGLSVSYVF